MYRIVTKKPLNANVTLFEIEAPLVAKKAEPGQFIILRVDEEGERIPIRDAVRQNPEAKSCAVVTGPEGGFEPFEVDMARKLGFSICSMGPRILRCETAPLCALSALMYAADELA